MKGIAEVIKRKDPVTEPKESDLDIPETVSSVEDTTGSVVVSEQTKGIDVGFTNLSSWFVDNVKNFQNIKQVKVSITGIDPNKTLIYTEPDPTPTDQNNRRLQVVYNATETPVLNMPGILFETYFSGFRVIHIEVDSKIIKSYIVKTGMYITHCAVVDGMPIPVKIEKVKKKSKGISFVSVDVKAIQDKLNKDADLENIQLQYKQIVKHVKDLKTVKETIIWMLQRQASISDINHHLKLDELMISLFN